MSKEFNELLDNVLRIEKKRAPLLQTHVEKKTLTPFGEVWSKLLTIKHCRPLKKGDLLGQYFCNKKTKKREKFFWLGIVEKSNYSPIINSYTIFYRPFCSQFERVDKRLLKINSQVEIARLVDSLK